MAFHGANNMLPAFATRLRLCAFIFCRIFSFCCRLLPGESSRKVPEGQTGARSSWGAAFSTKGGQDNCTSSVALCEPKWQSKSERGLINVQIFTNLSADWRNKCSKASVKGRCLKLSTKPILKVSEVLRFHRWGTVHQRSAIFPSFLKCITYLRRFPISLGTRAVRALLSRAVRLNAPKLAAAQLQQPRTALLSVPSSVSLRITSVPNQMLHTNPTVLLRPWTRPAREAE